MAPKGQQGHPLPSTIGCCSEWRIRSISSLFVVVLVVAGLLQLGILRQWSHNDAPSSLSIGSSINVNRMKSQEKKRNRGSHFTTDASSYQTDPLCGGCRSRLMPHLDRGIHKERCGILIYRNVMIANDNKNQNDITILQAAHQVIRNETFGDDCKACLECDPVDRRYWRYDRAAVPYAHPKTHYFDSIPPKHRIPTIVLLTTLTSTNMTEYFAKLNALPGNKPQQYLFEYNPSIVPLPSSMGFPTLEQQHGDKIVYIASFRVATQQGCFNVDTTLQMIGGDWQQERRPTKKDYLGVALLRDDLSVVAEAILDLPRRFHKREDFRLFVLHGQLYVSSYCQLTPFWIREATQKGGITLAFDNKTKKALAWAVDNVFSSPLRAWIGGDITLCAPEDEKANQVAKNLNYFVSATGDTMVEMFPLGPHVVRPLPHVRNASAPTPTQDDAISDNTTITSLTMKPSYYTIEELILAEEMDFFEPPFTQDRGGACCMEIPDPRGSATNNYLLLGISHVKTPHGRPKLEKRLRSNQYLSRWYAFEPTPPFRTVAVSGFFCWPAPSSSSSSNPLVTHHPDKHWTLGSISDLQCPVIHFISGMTEKVNDPETLIVAMGIADCTSWFVEVKKADIVQVLFDGPPLTVPEMKESSSLKEKN
jgi:hypothetical protein